MARLRSRPSSPGLWVLLGLIFLTFGLVAASSASSQSPSASPAADTDLICHTSNPAECYPKIFVPTDEFQPIHDDQDLPPGLHVRLNVWTGEKEAKINVPDEERADLAGLPVDSSVLVVDQDDQEIGLPAGAPVYEAAGKVKEPADVAESKAFFDSLKLLQKGLDVDVSFERLEELSHDIYYGLKIAEDYDTVRSLLCFTNTDQLYIGRAGSNVLKRAKLAALTIAGALQNNPKALAEVEGHWAKLRELKCKPGDDDAILASTFNLARQGAGCRAAPPREAGDADVVKAKVSALKSLLKSKVIRQDFLANDGMDALLTVLGMREEMWEPAKEKVALLVQDIFLDGDLGASLGEWPVDDQWSDSKCKGWNVAYELVPKHCWDITVKWLAEKHKADGSHWSHELLRQLKEARKGVPATYADRDDAEHQRDEL